MSLYGTDWKILVCEGCGKPLGDNTMGGIHTKCPENPEPGNRKTAPAFRRKRVYPEDEVVNMVLTGYSLYMAQRRKPGDITRSKDRDAAVLFLINEGIFSEEQLDPHISTSVRVTLDRNRTTVS